MGLLWPRAKGLTPPGLSFPKGHHLPTTVSWLQQVLTACLCLRLAAHHCQLSSGHCHSQAFLSLGQLGTHPEAAAPAVPVPQLHTFLPARSQPLPHLWP